MRRTVALLLAVSLLALPAAAMAQGAGDEQYSDPFGQTDQPNGSPDQAAPEQDAAPATPTAPAAPAEQAVTSQDAAAPTLPATGLPALLLASAGAMLLTSGAALRRHVS